MVGAGGLYTASGTLLQARLAFDTLHPRGGGTPGRALCLPTSSHLSIVSKLPSSSCTIELMKPCAYDALVRRKCANIKHQGFTLCCPQPPPPPPPSLCWL